jgi:hypothetical protein
MEYQSEVLLEKGYPWSFRRCVGLAQIASWQVSVPVLLDFGCNKTGSRQGRTHLFQKDTSKAMCNENDWTKTLAVGLDPSGSMKMWCTNLVVILYVAQDHLCMFTKIHIWHMRIPSGLVVDHGYSDLFASFLKRKNILQPPCIIRSICPRTQRI